jgi:formaldehyde-activating enzyme involved in methanogenesis
MIRQKIYSKQFVRYLINTYLAKEYTLAEGSIEDEKLIDKLREEEINLIRIGDNLYVELHSIDKFNIILNHYKSTETLIQAFLQNNPRNKLRISKD